ncbi:MAG: hypothetical protein HY348_02715 [Nitrospira defluvii]|nr:hypothetical protein [Nitrospira defluvii]
MTGTQRIAISVVLTLCLVALQGLVYPQVMEHASQHAHHGAGVHSTVLCSWMCAAGQDLDTASVLFQVGDPPNGVADHVVFESLPLESSTARTSRGPPPFHRS